MQHRVLTLWNTASATKIAAPTKGQLLEGRKSSNNGASGLVGTGVEEKQRRSCRVVVDSVKYDVVM